MILQRYNMNNHDSRSCYLAADAYVDQIDVYIGKAFEHPSGSIRLSDNTAFTHFVCEVAGVRYIYKITAVRAINGTVNEYDYTIDYLKDYFMKNALASLNDSFIKKGTVKNASWSRWVDDATYPDNGGVSRDMHFGADLRDRGDMYYLLVMNNNGNDFTRSEGFSYYLIPEGELTLFYESYTTSQFADAIYKQIKGLYLMPGVGTVDGEIVLYNCTKVPNATVRAQVNEGSGWTGFYNATRIYPTNPTLPVYTLWDTELSITMSDFIDVQRTSYEIYLPFFGTVGLPARLLNRLAEGNTEITINLAVTYAYNITDGRMCYYFTGQTAEFSNYVDMPMTYLPSGAQAFSLYSNSKIEYNTLLSTGLRAGLGLATGNPFTLATAATDALVSVVQSKTNEDLITAAGNTFTVSAGYDSYNDTEFKLYIYKPFFRYDYDVHGNKYGYIYNLPYSEAIKEIGGKYWLTMGNTTVNGLDWYKAGVVNDIEKDYIFLNGGYIPPTPPGPTPPGPTPSTTGTFALNSLAFANSYFLYNGTSYSVTTDENENFFKEEYSEIRSTDRVYGYAKGYNTYTDTHGDMMIDYVPTLTPIVVTPEQLFHYYNGYKYYSGQHSYSREMRFNISGDEPKYKVNYSLYIECPVGYDAEGNEIDTATSLQQITFRRYGSSEAVTVPFTGSWRKEGNKLIFTGDIFYEVQPNITYLADPFITIPKTNYPEFYYKPDTAQFLPNTIIKIENTLMDV